MEGVLLDNMLITLVAMFVTFIGVYLYMSKKLDQTNIADKMRLERKSSAKITATKFELEKNRIKTELHEIFSELSTEEQIQWIDELKNIHENPGQNNKAS